MHIIHKQLGLTLIRVVDNNVVEVHVPNDSFGIALYENKPSFHPLLTFIPNYSWFRAVCVINNLTKQIF